MRVCVFEEGFLLCFSVHKAIDQTCEARFTKTTASFVHPDTPHHLTCSYLLLLDTALALAKVEQHVGL